MLYHLENQISSIYHNGKLFVACYHLGKLVWSIQNSCFGSGYWDNNLPWSNEEAWKNG